MSVHFPFDIETAQLLLRPAELRHFEAWSIDESAFANTIGAKLEPGWDRFPGALKQAHECLIIAPDLIGWWTYFFVHKTHAKLIGTGGFHGKPDGKGEVEIGYCIAETYEGHNLATEAATGLIAFAFAHPLVTAVNARTLPYDNPSTSVLKKVGMNFVGAKTDPEDGEFWLWQRKR